MPGDDCEDNLPVNVPVAPAEHFDELDRAGWVAQGKRADLVLLSANPLVDIAAIAEARAGIMVAGRWLPEAEISQRLEEMAERHSP